MCSWEICIHFSQQQQNPAHPLPINHKVSNNFHKSKQLERAILSLSSAAAYKPYFFSQLADSMPYKTLEHISNRCPYSQIVS